jgi:hypothetical protein
MKNNKFIALSLVLSLACITALPLTAKADVLPDEQWSLPTTSLTQEVARAELQGFTIQENLQIAQNTSSLAAYMDEKKTQSEVRYCKTVNDEFCGSSKGMFFDAILPICSTVSEVNCIAGVSAISSSGKESVGSYVRNFPAAGYTDFPGSTPRNLPQGSTPSLWKIPGITHGGGTDEYLVNFTLRGGVGPLQDRFSFNNYSAFISPVTVQAGGYGRFEKKDGRGKDQVECVKLALACGTEMLGKSRDDTKICASIEEGACAAKQAFPTGYRLKLKVRLSDSPAGWLHGRLKAPEISITKVNSGVELSLEGEPVVVPVVGTTTTYAALPENMKTFYSNLSGQWSYGEQGPTGRRNQLSMPAPDQERTFIEYALWDKYVNDKASASPGFWTVRSLDVPQDSAECFRDSTKFIGAVTTNAMIYSGGPPRFNKDQGTLEYKVGAPHLTSKGEVFKGSYDLQVSAEVARCLYKFTAAPIQASISIVNESGENSIATTVLNEKDGWLRLAAYGFTFSTPTVRIKLSQEVKSVATPTPAPSAKTASVKKTSITCVKGKTTKKVTAIKPTCPTGYKKK